MVRGVWETFLALYARAAGDAGDDEEEERRRFVPSPLDLSVRVGHGGRDDEVQRELSKISERASELEEGQGGN